jgi:hypothetical protein
MEKANTLRILERKVVRNIHGPIQERMLENKNKQKDKGHVTEGRYCKIYNIPRSSLGQGKSG